MRDWQLRFWNPATEGVPAGPAECARNVGRGANGTSGYRGRAATAAGGAGTVGRNRLRGLCRSFRPQTRYTLLRGHALRNRHSHREPGGHHRPGPRVYCHQCRWWPPRTPASLTALRAFLQTLADNAAVCSLAHDGDRFRFRDAAQARRGERSLTLPNGAD